MEYYSFDYYVCLQIVFSNEKWKIGNLKSSFHKELYSTYYTLGTALGIWDTHIIEQN